MARSFYCEACQIQNCSRLIVRAYSRSFRVCPRAGDCRYATLAPIDGTRGAASALLGGRERFNGVIRGIIKVSGRWRFDDAREPTGYAQLRPAHLIITRANKALKIDGRIFGSLQLAQ